MKLLKQTQNDMNIKLEKIRKSVYYDNISSRYIELKNKIWQVNNICDGRIYFTAKTLKKCKVYQSQENDIKSWLDY